MSRLHRPTPSTQRWKGFAFPRSWWALPLALALMACRVAAPGGTPTTGVPVASPAATETSENEGSTFPLSLVDAEGTEVTLPADPERIVSLTPAVTETLFALGEGNTVVGGTDFDDHPPEAVPLPDVATFEGVLIERVVDLEPDLVVAGGNAFTPPDDVERLRELGIPVLVVYAETVDEVLADIELLGRAAGAADEAREMTAEMERSMEAIADAAAATGDRPRVFYELGDQPEIYGPAEDSFIADLIELAGGEPITTGDPIAFSIPLERLVAADPEVIVLGDADYGVTPELVAQRPGGWARMTAVRNGDVRPIDDIIVTRPGPRLADGLAALAEAIHPELDLDAGGASSPAASASPTPG